MADHHGAVIVGRRDNDRFGGLPRMRILAVASLAAALGGCANEHSLSVSHLTAGGIDAAAAEPMRDPSKKSIAGKALAAIAFERVTGLKPDPACLNNLR